MRPGITVRLRRCALAFPFEKGIERGNLDPAAGEIAGEPLIEPREPLKHGGGSRIVTSNPPAFLPEMEAQNPPVVAVRFSTIRVGSGCSTVTRHDSRITASLIGMTAAGTVVGNWHTQVPSANCPMSPGNCAMREPLAA